MIKCVVWDLDNTLLDGVYLESPDKPPSAVPALAAVVAELAARGILHAIASRNPPEAAGHAEQATGHRFAAAACGWGAKSQAVTEIMAELELEPGAVAFVDDDPLERAEVAHAHPGVLVLAPQEVPEAAGWPQFSPPVITDEARRRGELYLARRARREEEAAFGGSREEFLRHCRTQVTIAPAGPADLPRLHELSARTRQFNSAGAALSRERLARLLAAPDRRVIAVRLRDRFGDDGLVGAAVVALPAAAPGEWSVELLMMSCRAMGRGVIEALLAWICRAARSAGAGRVSVACVVSPRNVPLRIALAATGFRAAEPAVAPAAGGGHRMATYSRRLDGSLPELPGWARGTW